MSASLKTALSVARNNSRRTKSCWIVLKDELGFDVQEAGEFVPRRVVGAFDKGKRLPDLTVLAVNCGNHPYEDGL